MYLLFTDTTAQQERSQCPLVEKDSITSLLILLCSIMSMLDLTSKSMVKQSVLPEVKRTHRHLVMQFTPHAVRSPLLLKVK